MVIEVSMRKLMIWFLSLGLMVVIGCNSIFIVPSETFTPTLPDKVQELVPQEAETKGLLRTI